MLERISVLIVEHNIFRRSIVDSGHGAVDRLFSLARTLWGSTCVLCTVLWEGILLGYCRIGSAKYVVLWAVWSLYNWSVRCVCILGRRSSELRVHAKLCQYCISAFCGWFCWFHQTVDLFTEKLRNIAATKTLLHTTFVYLHRKTWQCHKAAPLCDFT